MQLRHTIFIIIHTKSFIVSYIVYELAYLKESVHEASLLTTETVTDGESIALVSKLFLQLNCLNSLLYNTYDIANLNFNLALFNRIANRLMYMT